ncbi:hypothetical protein [Nesterenkonia marinintestina]|uniref:hypothetical protein n=1 Tax=Nesterenkonia marinintestina TaxID=2979865 RepID=UPI0021BEE7E8|nr:hypothetical protein [Nesterenkonia sp. GX14115]
MTSAEIWPRLPRCTCSDWFEGFAAGHVHGARDARAELAERQLQHQQRIAAQMEPAATVIAGLRALRARKDARRNERRTAA